MKVMLRGLMQPAKGHVLPTSPWFGDPTFDLRYDPEEAKRLMAEAGFSKAKPLAVKVMISASGSGQMQPLRSEEHTSELQSLMRISYAVFCLKKKQTKATTSNTTVKHTIN